ncbi:MAG: hypothetical protein KKC21_07010 [Nitrospinae bacterium]|nr:hypothetical protein [Nitrospinota bacterium]
MPRSSEKNIVVYGSAQRNLSFFLFLLAIFIGYGGYSFWQTGEVVYAVFMAMAALLILGVGITIFARYERIIFDFAGERIVYQKRGRSGETVDCQIPFDMVENLSLITSPEMGGGAGSILHYGNLVFKETITGLPEGKELTICQNLDRRAVAKELEWLAERGGFGVLPPSM